MASSSYIRVAADHTPTSSSILKSQWRSLKETKKENNPQIKSEETQTTTTDEPTAAFVLCIKFIHDDQIWIGEASEVNYDQSTSLSLIQWSQYTKFAFGHEQPSDEGIKTFVDVQTREKGRNMNLVWGFYPVQDIKIILGNIDLCKSKVEQPESKNAIHLFLFEIIEDFNALKNEFNHESKQLRQVNMEMHDLLERQSKWVDLKLNEENFLYEKFAAILNAKKRKISKLLKNSSSRRHEESTKDASDTDQVYDESSGVGSIDEIGLQHDFSQINSSQESIPTPPKPKSHQDYVNSPRIDKSLVNDSKKHEEETSKRSRIIDEVSTTPSKIAKKSERMPEKRKLETFFAGDSDSD